MEVILHLTSGAGPLECRWVVAELTRAFAREAAKQGLACKLLDGGDELPVSVLLRISGAQASAFAAQRTGTVQWIGKSHFRPGHKRQNWYVGVSLAPEPETLVDLNEADIDYQAMRERAGRPTRQQDRQRRSRTPPAQRAGGQRAGAAIAARQPQACAAKASDHAGGAARAIEGRSPPRAVAKPPRAGTRQPGSRLCWPPV